MGSDVEDGCSFIIISMPRTPVFASMYCKGYDSLVFAKERSP
jgi:hypothetical protein